MGTWNPRATAPDPSSAKCLYAGSLSLGPVSVPLGFVSWTQEPWTLFPGMPPLFRGVALGSDKQPTISSRTPSSGKDIVDVPVRVCLSEPVCLHICLSPSPSVSLSVSPSSPAPLWLAWAPRFSVCRRVLLCLSASPISFCLLTLQPSWVPAASQPPSASVSGSASWSPRLCVRTPAASLCPCGPLSVTLVCVRTPLSYSFYLCPAPFLKGPPFCSSPAPSSLGPSSQGKTVQVKNSRKNKRQRGTNWKRESEGSSLGRGK